MQATVILTRPGIRHAVDRQLRTVAALKRAQRDVTAAGRYVRLAGLIADHEAQLAAIDAADDDLAELLLLGRADVRGGR